MATDTYGNPVTLTDPGSITAVNDLVEGFPANQARAIALLQIVEREPAPLVQAYAAMLHLFAETRAGFAQARDFLARARNTQALGSPREHSFIEMLQAWLEEDFARVFRLHDEHARQYPRDLVALKLGLIQHFNLGDSTGMLRLALLVPPGGLSVGYLHGMRAFAYEQCHLLDKAQAEAERALQITPSDPWSHHALAHVDLTRGQLLRGRDRLAGFSSHWVGLNSFMQTHNWWHLALFELELGRTEQALALYDREVWGVQKDYSQDQIGAVSLLARLEFAGVDVGRRWHDLARHLALRAFDHVLPFLDLQYLYGLGRADRPEANALLNSMQEFAARATHPVRQTWQQVAVPAGQGALALARGRHAEAAGHLQQALPGLLSIGGSHAQRDLFEQMLMAALLGSGQYNAAQNLLQQRRNSQPESLRLQGQLEQLYRQLDLQP